MQHDIVLKKLNFELLTPRVRGVWVQKYLLPCCYISNKFDMQHDHVLKKMNFDLLTPSLGMLEGGCLRQSIYFNVAAFHDSRSFDMQHDHVLKKLYLTY